MGWPKTKAALEKAYETQLTELKVGPMWLREVLSYEDPLIAAYVDLVEQGKVTCKSKEGILYSQFYVL